MNRSRKTRSNKERGVAMLVAIMAMVLLAIIGLGFMYMSNSENSANSNYKDAQRAYFASRAGLESVRAMLAFNPGGPTAFFNQVNTMPMPAVGVPAGMIYVENSTGGAVDPTAGTTLDTELCKEQFTGLAGLLAPGPQGAPCTTASPDYSPVVNPSDIPNSSTQGAFLFPWVRVTNKQNYMGLVNQMVDGSNPATATTLQMHQQVCWDGLTQYPVATDLGQTCANQTSPGTGGQMNPVWLLTSLAVTPGLGSKPGSRRITQMEVAIPPPLYVLPNGTVAAKAPITIQGQLNINSYDNCSCTATGGDLPGAPQGSCDKSKWAIYSASSISQNGNATTLTSGQNPPIDQNATWPYKIPQLIDALSNGVPPYTTSCTGVTDPYAVPSVNANCGTISGAAFGGTPQTIDPTTYQTGQGPTTTFIPGSVQLDGNTSGSGILIVDGDLNVHGGLNFYGLIIVLGRISFTGGGSQNVNLYGALLAGQDVNAQDISESDSIGGSFNFHYDSCALKLPSKQIPGPPAMLAEHEAMF